MLKASRRAQRRQCAIHHGLEQALDSVSYFLSPSPLSVVLLLATAAAWHRPMTVATTARMWLNCMLMMRDDEH